MPEVQVINMGLQVDVELEPRIQVSFVGLQVEVALPEVASGNALQSRLNVGVDIEI